MLDFNQPPSEIINFLGIEIYSFLKEDDSNIDRQTVKSFGEEWEKFSHFNDDEIQKAGEEYFDIVNESNINKDSLVLDLGCGSGRWSRFLSDKVKFIHAIDPSDAIYAAVRYTKDIENIKIAKASIDNIPFQDESFDFVFSLGVLHHIPDTEKALKMAVKKLKKGRYILLYLYYNMDNRSSSYKFLFFLSNIGRKMISALPSFLKKIVCDLLSVLIYMPFIWLARIVKVLLKNDSYKKLPLAYYHDKSYRIIRNDTLDRFGTPLEQRFSKEEITQMMKNADLADIVFSAHPPFWHVIGKRN